jgi:ribosomal protein S18 acetylase RimI-like enzyme
VIDPSDTGARVSVRHALADGRRTDVLGVLESWRDGRLAIRTSGGQLVEVDEGDLVAARTVPPPPPPRRPGVPHVSPEDMQRLADAGWPARERERLGDWLLRSHAGITGRANSAMVVGDPGLPLPEALERVRAWYEARGLPALAQLPEQDRRNEELERRGWRRLHVTLVQAAGIGTVLDLVPPRPELRALLEPRPSAEWRALMHDLDPADPEAHVAILTGPPVVGFATLYDGSTPVAIGRASVEQGWAGVTSVDVAPQRRREGLGSTAMRVLLEWAGGRGATATYLQVRARNEPALALYRRLGYLTHHAYCYRSPAGAGTDP